MGQGSLLEDHVGFSGTCLPSKCKEAIWRWPIHSESERRGGPKGEGISMSFGVRRAKLQFLLATYWSGSTQVTWTRQLEFSHLGNGNFRDCLRRQGECELPASGAG